MTEDEGGRVKIPASGVHCVERDTIFMSKEQQPNNPLHGVTLEAVVTKLVDHYGWSELADRININCFKKDPSVKSSLSFLRKTPWAREQVERLYVATKFKSL